MKFFLPTDNNFECGRRLERSEITKAQRREASMSALHQMVPVFFLIQFVIVLVALVAAILMVDSQFSLPAKKSSRRAIAQGMEGLRD
jgi:hypothetical protein